MHTYVSFIHALFFSCIYIHWYIHTHSHIPNRCQSYSASHCNRLQYTATHRNIWMRHVTLTPCQSYSRRTAIKDDCITRHATHMNAPPVSYAATHCNTLYHTATDERVTQQDTHMTEPVSYAATHCNTLQHTATDDSTSHTYEWAIVIFCNTLQHTATHCNTLQQTATPYNILLHTATRCNIWLRHTTGHTYEWAMSTYSTSAIFCITLQHAATRCNTLQHTATYYNTWLRHIQHHTATQRNTLTRCQSYSASCCNTLQLAATRCNILQHMIEAHSTSNCNTTQHTHSMPIIFSKGFNMFWIIPSCNICAHARKHTQKHTHKNTHTH